MRAPIFTTFVGLALFTSSAAFADPATDTAPAAAAPADAASGHDAEDAAAPPAEKAADAPLLAATAPPTVIDNCPEIDDSEVAALPDESDDLKARVKAAMAEGNLALALLLVLVAGFLTALTPCVYPLIPITLSIFGARQTTAVRGFLLSSTYVGGMVALYTTLGTAFAAFGFLAGSALQSPVVTIGVALFCLIMAASMFGAFEIALPGNMQTRLSQMGGAGFKGAFVMGLVAGIIAAPCTGPVLSFILALIATDGDVARGALFMFVYALGIGLPFLVLGTFSTAIARIPKSGGWMETVKSVFGVMMIVAGLYYLQFGIPVVGKLIAGLGHYGLAPGIVLIVLGVAAGAFHLSFKYVTRSEQIRKGVGVLLTVGGLMSLVGWVSGEPATTTSTEAGEAPHLTWQKVGNEDTALESFDAFLAKAKADCKPVMIDFFADWCAACKELDKLTYVDPAVREEAQRFVTVKVDATDDTDDLTAIQKRFSIVGLPTVVFIDSHGRVKERPRVTGFVEAKEYLPLMKSVR